MRDETVRSFTERFGCGLASGKSPEAAARAAGARVVKPVDPFPRVRRLLAAAHAAKGIGPAAVGRSMGISPGLARAWILKGRRDWQADPEAARQLLVAYLGREVAAVALAGTELAESTPDGTS